MSNEPEQLRRGKMFQEKIQQDWKHNAEGSVTPEKGIKKLSGRRGRIDVHVRDGDLTAVVEIKASDWESMSMKALRRNARRQIKQIWDYIESQLQEGDVSPGVIFAERPKDSEKLKLIESMFAEEGIPVVWDDESLEERRAR